MALPNTTLYTYKNNYRNEYLANAKLILLHDLCYVSASIELASPMREVEFIKTEHAHQNYFEM